MYKFWIIGLVLAMLEDLCSSVKIQKITVPSVVVMDYNLNLSERPNLSAPEFLLDCDFDMEENESGLVIKWLLNNQAIYQWIPPRLPTALSLLKNRIRKNFTVSDDPMKKYRGLAVTKPMLNFSGNYTCSVQTFQSSDKKTSHLQIIVPESHFKLNYRTDFDSMVQIKCSAFNVYPEPKLSLNINNVELKSDVKLVKDSRDGLFDVKVVAKYPKNSLKSETIINCQLTIPDTNYTKIQETVYYEQEPTSSDPDSDEEADLVLSLETETGLLTNQHTKDHSASSSKPFTIVFFECYMILFFTIFVTKLC
ncbi:CLUMA_CG001770, isoform A [Clunio marinus]|uniref:CLUMA_CG001770, isoform A n=1 Tax=Clunio marinus TaxID=568069 RepID=A0A1J1HIV5_9DIPT|nr:CLUMA_CG001770, isoform A [Clunio marinus]